MIMKNIAKNKIYYHYRNKKPYVVIDFGKIQVNDEWSEAVIYKEYKKEEKYIRTLSEFSEKFIEKEKNEWKNYR